MSNQDNNVEEGSTKLDGPPSLPPAKSTGQPRKNCVDFPDDLFLRLITFKNTEQDLIDAGVYSRKHGHLHTCNCPRPTRTTNQYQLGAREFTLTYSPKWFDDLEARLKMSKAVDKLIRYYKDEIINFRAIGEVGTNGLSHIHCFYKLRGGIKMTDKNFKRAWPHWNPRKQLGWGFEGGHHATVKSESDFLGYIEKDIDTAWFEKTVADNPREN